MHNVLLLSGGESAVMQRAHRFIIPGRRCIQENRGTTTRRESIGI
jgi:hypothetical protein